MTNLNFDPFIWIQLLLPGFIFVVTRRLLGSKSTDGIALISMFIYGIGIVFFTTPLLALFNLHPVSLDGTETLSEALTKAYRWKELLFVGIQGVVIPFLIAAVGSLIENFAKKSKTAKKLSSETPIEDITAMEYAWSRAEEKVQEDGNVVIAIVTMTDGSIVAGMIDSDSFMDRRKDGGSIYLSKAYKGVDGKYHVIKQSTGVFISGEEIKTINFLGTRRKSVKENQK